MDELKKMQGRIARVVCCLLLAACLGLAGCGSKDSAQVATPSDFQAQLYKELKALGKDPSQTTTEAPAKDDDTVFDLSAVLLDGNGQPLPPGSPGVSGVRLSWTERLTGDYDQNGEVNSGDLAPLAQHLQAAVQYDASGQHGGFAFWPTGDADGPGATNWRLARIDGDGNGLTNAADITPIAKHWKEALQGYRVYRKAPSDTSFKLLPNPDNSASAFTMTKPTPPQPGQLVPVRYSFTDSQATAGNLGAGVYEFYVAPYDAGSKQEGISSFAVSVDITMGTVNYPPQAVLSVTPDVAGAPAVVTLDASSSRDIDGTVQSYAWDLDGDGIVDYTSTDPALPAQSSSGAAVGLTVLGTGKLQVTFPNGSDQWFNPTVTVLDNQGFPSPPATHPLAVTGWQSTVITGGKQISHDVDFQVLDMQPDPASGRVLAVGIGQGDKPYPAAPGVCTAWIDSNGISSAQQVLSFTDQQFAAIYGSPLNSSPSCRFVLGFTNDKRPLIAANAILQSGFSYYYKVFTIEQLPSNLWQVKQLTVNYNGVALNLHSFGGGNYDRASGLLAFNCSASTGDGTTLAGDDRYYAYYRNNGWTLENAKNQDIGSNGNVFLFDQNNGLHCLPGGDYWNQSGIFFATYQAPETWKVDTLATGEFDLSGRKTVVSDYGYGADGKLYLTISRFLSAPPPYYDNADIVVLKQTGTGFEATTLGDLDGHESDFWLQDGTAYVFSYGERTASDNEGFYLQEVTPSGLLVGDTICSIASGAGTPPIESLHSCINVDKAAYAVYSVGYGPDGNAQYFARRLDPRVLHPYTNP